MTQKPKETFQSTCRGALFFLNLSNYLCFLLTAGKLTKSKRLELVKTLKGQKPQEDPSNQGENLAL